jgi:hypothetical protein
MEIVPALVWREHLADVAERFEEIGEVSRADFS